jgi:alcohol dehydrogenase
VKSVSVNPVDYKIVKGEFKLDSKPFPKPVGSDVSGTIVAVGSDIKSSLKVGDKVWSDAIGFGPMAEFCAVDEGKVALKPATLSFNEAATIPLAGMTALQALRDYGKIFDGAKVLIYGGSGGVGSFAIQIAKEMTGGASMIATTSTNKKLCKSLGATHVVNYREAKVEEALQEHKFDLIFDTVGGYDHWVAAKKLMAPSGHYVTIAGDGVSLPRMILRIIWRKLMAMVSSSPSYDIFLTNANSADLDVLKGMVEEGKLKAVMDTAKPFKFNDTGARALFAKIMTGRTKGKLVMEVSV